ncbi:MAG: hypothetical protein U5L76_06175 [Patescibacteria group bacterium]|nr:hypothetical protein [Patescibacteria group bacterium]
MIKEKKYNQARKWSNKELKKFCHLFKGDVLNVSGWKDEDKEGDHYKNYFKNSNNYHISNYKSSACGFQGFKNEFFLDLSKTIPNRLIKKYDVIFNHTTLEHIYNFRKAFTNLCLMSKDTVILVVPFLQQMHSNYGDYWRFTPSAIKKMFEEENMLILYSSFNEGKKESVYLFFIASKKTQKWKEKIGNSFTYKANKKEFLGIYEQFVGNRAIVNSFLYKLLKKVFRVLNKK